MSFGLKNTVFNYFGHANPRTVTCKVVGAATGKRFVKLVAGGTDQVPNVSVCGAGERPYGVLDGDAVDGEKRTVWLSPAGLSVTAGAALTAADEVMSDASGRAVPYAAAVDPAVNHRIGTVVADAALGEDAHIEY